MIVHHLPHLHILFFGNTCCCNPLLVPVWSFYNQLPAKQKKGGRLETNTHKPLGYVLFKYMEISLPWFIFTSYEIEMQYQDKLKLVHPIAQSLLSPGFVKVWGRVIVRSLTFAYLKRLFSDSNLWPTGHQVTTLPLCQGSPSIPGQVDEK